MVTAPRSTAVATLTALAALLAVTTCRDDRGTEPRPPTMAPGAPSFATSSASGPVTLVGAGNIAKCGQPGAGATANLLDAIPGTVFADGDNAYDNGTLNQYNTCYNPTWGRHKARTQPAPGERDYKTANAAGYFGYFGSAAGDPKQGYYSYTLGAWHIIVLNSGSNSLVPTTATSPQVQWLKSDLATHPAQCTLAYWHNPLFDSKDKPNTAARPLWDVLYAAGVDVVVNAHYAFYERFAPQTPTGAADPTFGMREFVVGTGGAEVTSFGAIRPNSEVRSTGTSGVLQLTLNDGGYAWQFVPVAGKTFSDSGTGACHGAPPLPVNAGSDVTTHPGDTVKVSVAFSDPGVNTAPWNYTIRWGDGGSSTGTASTQTAPITASHVYAALGLDSVRATITNAVGAFGGDSLAVQVVARPIAPAVLVGAGDIADCTRNQDSLTANLLDTIPGTVFALGDNAYPDGTSSQYTTCYGSTWGRFKSRTRPVPGNHDYNTPGAAGYFGYFGAAAGDPATGYYSYDLGAWHIVALNSDASTIAGSSQEQWLRADLAAHPAQCTLAYWHHPLFSSSTVAVDTSTRALWQALYEAGAELVLNGHHHDYERFAPQTPAGVADPAFGIREIIAGTGGSDFHTLGPTVPNSEARNDQTFGVLKLTLSSGGYDWKFIPIAGQTFTDAGSGTCHDAYSAANHAPTAAPAGPYAGTEGVAVSFTGTGSSDPDGDALTYAWTFGDGTSGTGVSPTHAYADNGSYTVTLTVTDIHGASSTPGTTTATIANATPAVNVADNQPATAGSPFNLSAAFSDAGVNDAPWSYAIDWGDGSPQATGSTSSQTSPIAASHTYAAAGSDILHVTVTDKDGAAGSSQSTVTVTSGNHQPVAAVAGPYSGAEGALVSFDGSGSSDPDGDALTYAWTFGDGATATGAKPAHAYADNGAYTVTLTVTDTHGASSAPATTTATIANAAPSVSAGGDQTASAGLPFTVRATFSDAGVSDAPWAYAIDWGDGSPQTTGSTTGQANPITAIHTYGATGTDVVRVTVTDKDGGAGSGTAAITVTSPVTLVGAGNIARCTTTDDATTAALLDAIPGTVFTIGDAAYPNGTLTNYQTCYDPTWGRFKGRTYPAPGNHDYDSSATAAGYFGYFGTAAGDPSQGYYSYDLGAWHIVVLNSNYTNVPTAAGSAQETWLKADLAASTKKCQLAMWHSPRFYSTTATSFSPTGYVKPFWDDLYAAGAELIINAHMQDYERFAPQTPAGVADPVNGIRQIIVGTGGSGLDTPNTLIIPNSEVQISRVFGVLKLTLGDGTYTWQFIPGAGQTATDSGSGTCH